MPEQSNKTMVVGIVAITLLVFVGLVWAVMRAPADSLQPVGDENVSFSDTQDPSFGPADAKVTVHAYGDFQCPACRVAEPGFQYAKNTYGDRVRFIWKDFPLSQIHKNAIAGANAARCAQVQGRFWEFHDALYVHQPEWAELANPKDSFLTYAKDTGLNGATFEACYDARAQASKINADYSEGIANKVNATPTFFINKRRAFAMSPAEWDKVLREALGETATSTSVATSTSP